MLHATCSDMCEDSAVDIALRCSHVEQDRPIAKFGTLNVAFFSARRPFSMMIKPKSR